MNRGIADVLAAWVWALRMLSCKAAIRSTTLPPGDLALGGHRLPAGTVLDGEGVITTEDGRISFEAAQARAASSPTRAHRLATQRPCPVHRIRRPATAVRRRPAAPVQRAPRRLRRSWLRPVQQNKAA
ncbi:DNA ligase-like domain-containing protein [Streptomyces olivochromogenes]|uniref:hypothetical protein n=1 Tax=Streptomyces olivochromogenes TaxID=1963 RepID=UPI00368FBE7F